MPRPVLSTVVPATDAPPTLERCVAALRAALPEGSELIVQGEPAGAGPSEARNRGAARASGDVLLFVDADVVVHPEAPGAIAERFEHDPSLGAVFGSYDARPAAAGLVSRFRNLLHHHVHATSAGEAETFWAGLGAVRRKAFEQSGGFDAARYPAPAIEDIELGARLRALGWRIELDPSIQGTHLKRWTLGSMVRTDFARRGVPWALLRLERPGAAGGLNLAPRRMLGALAAAGSGLALLRRRPLVAAGSLGLMAALHASLFALLARAGGARLALAGVPLLALHLWTAAASVPAALVARLAGKRTRR